MVRSSLLGRLLLPLALAVGASAKLFVATILSSDMVLPSPNATLWGTSTPGAHIALTISRAGRRTGSGHTTVADATGAWVFHLALLSTILAARARHRLQRLALSVITGLVWHPPIGAATTFG